jgi:hypothetical protein
VVPSDAVPGDQFGGAVALDGSTLAALSRGSNGFDGAGYIFEAQPFALTSGEYKPREKRLTGSFTANGISYSASVMLDPIRYGNGVSHKAYIAPAEYRAEPGPQLAAVASELNCGFGGKGLRGFAGERPAARCFATIEGTRYPFDLTEPKSGDRGEGLATAWIGDGRRVGGELVDDRGAATGLFISLLLDEIGYGSSIADRAFIRAQYAGHKFDLSQLEGTRIRITGCDTVHPRGKGTDGFFAREPVINCSWKRGNGAQPPSNLGTVRLQ